MLKIRILIFFDKVEKNVIFGRFLDFWPIMIFWLKKRENLKFGEYRRIQIKKYVTTQYLFGEGVLEFNRHNWGKSAINQQNLCFCPELFRNWPKI